MLPRPWIFLAAAITAEVLGLSTMKMASETNSLAFFAFMYAMIGLAFYFFATSVKDLPIALAYATWETCGLILITIISVRFFGENLSPQKMAGIFILITGVAMINFGSKESPETSK
ncbi:DMT family transporter [Ottowia caeni]|uniref:SMR family transporter n=1 Tax=Ottowia caeni TaxID=2870339 RepID=UPI001E412890|nr:multidrug efflux SMR transporter [Ottowia caeni]